MTIYGVYENDEYQECRFVGTAKEIAEEFGCNYKNIRKASCYNRVFAEKYKIISLYEIKEETDI